MTDEELKALIESNARTAQANVQSITELAHSFIEFRNELRSWVNTHNAISDDQGTDLARLSENSTDTDARINALRMDAIADRAAFKERADADRTAFIARADADREAFVQQADADRQEWQQSFNAQMEAMRSQLLEMGRINRRLDNLEQAG